MPAVTVLYPRHHFDATDKVRFKRTVRNSVAVHMDAINPATGERTNFAAEVEKSIDLVLIPYDPEDADVTALCLATIVTYDWPDRMANLADRI